MLLLTTDNKTITGKLPALAGTKLSAIVLLPSDIKNNKLDVLIDYINNTLITRFHPEEDSCELECFLKDALQKHQNQRHPKNELS